MTSQRTPDTHSRRRRLLSVAPLSVALAGSLLLAGCAEPEPRGAGNVDALSGVSLEVAEDGKPSVKVDKTIEATEVSSRVLKDGDGEDINNGMLALVQTAVADPASGEVQADNFTQGSEAVFVNDTLKQTNTVLYDMLDQNKVGAQVAFYMPANPQAQQGAAGQASTGQLMVFQIAGTAPMRAEGKAVEVTDETLPKVTVDEKTGEPTIAKPEGDAPKDLVIQPLIQGDGPTVNATDHVTVRYKGVNWSKGVEFDSDWKRGTPTGFGLNQVIPGWTEGLTGQKVGSQVLLVVPPSKGYGEQGSGENIGPNETLVFVVDILHAMPAAQPEPAPAPSGESSAPAESPTPQPSGSGSASPAPSAAPSSSDS